MLFLILCIPRAHPVPCYWRSSHWCLGGSAGPRNIWSGKAGFQNTGPVSEVFFPQPETLLEELFPSKGSVKRASQPVYSEKSLKCTRCIFCPVSLYENNCLEIWCWLFSVLKDSFLGRSWNVLQLHGRSSLFLKIASFHEKNICHLATFCTIFTHSACTNIWFWHVIQDIQWAEKLIQPDCQ